MSITDDNVDLVQLLAFLSIKKTIIKPVTKIVEGEADYKLLSGNHLLNKEIYFSVPSISKKRHQTFWEF